MSFLYSIIAGIVSGLLSTILVFAFWQFQKPKLEISKEIAKNPRGEYRIKIVNKTKRYVSNVKILLQVVKRSNGTNGDVFNTYDLHLPYSEIPSIDPRKNPEKSTDYAIRIVMPKDLDTHWVNDAQTSLKLILHCSNSFNTANNTFVQYYRRKNVIKNGEFECGDSMRIIEENHTK